MQFVQLGRREFITLGGGAAAWPLATQAKQAILVMGFLGGWVADQIPNCVAGLKEAGLRAFHQLIVRFNSVPLGDSCSTGVRRGQGRAESGTSG